MKTCYHINITYSFKFIIKDRAHVQYCIYEYVAKFINTWTLIYVMWDQHDCFLFVCFLQVVPNLWTGKLLVCWMGKLCFDVKFLSFWVNYFRNKTYFKKLAYRYYNKCFLWRNLCWVWKKKTTRCWYSCFKLPASTCTKHPLWLTH